MTREHFFDAFTVYDLNEILENVSDAIFVDDENGIALWCNQSCENMFEIKLEDIQGKHVSELETEGVFSPSVASIVLNTEEQTTILHENRSGRKLLSTGTPIFKKDGSLSKIVTTSRDITMLTSIQNKLYNLQTFEQSLSIGGFDLEGVIAASPSMRQVIILTKRLAAVDSTVLITGESGVGKGVIAGLLHKNGKRKDRPFVNINCGAIPASLIESELFGYERGAFTGSLAEGKKGLFEEAQGGTIFLDEISELPLNLQVTLLQVIQDKEIKRVGGTKAIPVDVRIVSATNKDLSSLVASGKFREDLYYRLNVVPINVPPLRERREDIIPLIMLTLETYNRRLGEAKTIDVNSTSLLLKYNWPGNVRELQNIIERLIITTKSDVILPEHIPLFLQEVAQNHWESAPTTLKEAIEQAERNILMEAYENHKSTRAMAKALGVSQPTIVRKLQRYKIVSAIQE